MRKFHKKGSEKVVFKNFGPQFNNERQDGNHRSQSKGIRPIVEKAMTLAKKNNLASLRLLLSRLTKDSANKLYYELAQNIKTELRIFTHIENWRTRNAMPLKKH